SFGPPNETIRRSERRSRSDRGLRGPPSAPAERSAALHKGVDLLRQHRVFGAGRSAALLDFVELAPRGGDVAQLQVGFTLVLRHRRVVGIVVRRFLVIAEADEDAALLAMGIAEVVEDTRVGLVGGERQDLDGLAVATLLGQRTAGLVDALVVDHALTL